VGLLGILLGLGLLIWLSYRGWSVLLLAPVAALQSRSVPLADIKRRPRVNRQSLDSERSAGRRLRGLS
jgi:hypothetical protein